jgi:hypothetical protein
VERWVLTDRSRAGKKRLSGRTGRRTSATRTRRPVMTWLPSATAPVVGMMSWPAPGGAQLTSGRRPPWCVTGRPRREITQPSAATGRPTDGSDPPMPARSVASSRRPSTGSWMRRTGRRRPRTGRRRRGIGRQRPAMNGHRRRIGRRRPRIGTRPGGIGWRPPRIGRERWGIANRRRSSGPSTVTSPHPAGPPFGVYRRYGVEHRRPLRPPPALSNGLSRPSSVKWLPTLPVSRCMSSWPPCRRGWATRIGRPRRGPRRSGRGSSTGRRVRSWRSIWRGSRRLRIGRHAVAGLVGEAGSPVTVVWP